ncbi:hypothetical protein [Neobacillus sp. B4I6]
MARDRGSPSLAYQLLIYPVTHHSYHTDLIVKMLRDII